MGSERYLGYLVFQRSRLPWTTAGGAASNHIRLSQINLNHLKSLPTTRPFAEMVSLLLLLLLVPAYSVPSSHGAVPLANGTDLDTQLIAALDRKPVKVCSKKTKAQQNACGQKLLLLAPLLNRVWAGCSREVMLYQMQQLPLKLRQIFKRALDETTASLLSPSSAAAQASLQANNATECVVSPDLLEYFQPSTHQSRAHNGTLRQKLDRQKEDAKRKEQRAAKNAMKARENSLMYPPFFFLHIPSTFGLP